MRFLLYWWPSLLMWERLIIELRPARLNPYGSLNQYILEPKSANGSLWIVSDR
jgi:hypothetical protein